MQNRTSWYHFLPHFSTDQNEMECGVEAIQAEIPGAIFEWDLMKKRKW